MHSCYGIIKQSLVNSCIECAKCPLFGCFHLSFVRPWFISDSSHSAQFKIIRSSSFDRHRFALLRSHSDLFDGYQSTSQPSLSPWNELDNPDNILPNRSTAWTNWKTIKLYGGKWIVSFSPWTVHIYEKYEDWIQIFVSTQCWWCWSTRTSYELNGSTILPCSWVLGCIRARVHYRDNLLQI